MELLRRHIREAVHPVGNAAIGDAVEVCNVAEVVGEDLAPRERLLGRSVQFPEPHHKGIPLKVHIKRRCGAQKSQERESGTDAHRRRVPFG